MNHKLIMENWRNFQERSLLLERFEDIAISPDFEAQKPGMFSGKVSDKKKNKLQKGARGQKFRMMSVWYFWEDKQTDSTKKMGERWETLRLGEDIDLTSFLDEDKLFISSEDEVKKIVRDFFMKNDGYKLAPVVKNRLPEAHREIASGLNQDAVRDPNWDYKLIYVYLEPNDLIDYSLIYHPDDNGEWSIENLRKEGEKTRKRAQASKDFYRPQKKSWLQKLTGK